MHHKPHLEMEVLDETVLQPENYDQDQNQDRGSDLDDMDSMVGKTLV